MPYGHADCTILLISDFDTKLILQISCSQLSYQYNDIFWPLKNTTFCSHSLWLHTYTSFFACSWYKVDYNMADALAWGFNSGCTIPHGSCREYITQQQERCVVHSILIVRCLMQWREYFSILWWSGWHYHRMYFGSRVPIKVQSSE